MTKFCKDCKYFTISEVGDVLCKHPLSSTVYEDIVNGNYTMYKNCPVARSSISFCKNKGFYFEPFEPKEEKENE